VIVPVFALALALASVRVLMAALPRQQRGVEM
jgi:hypothetical protein